MGHAVGDIVEVTWRQKAQGQRMMNIQHYRVESSSSQQSDAQDNQALADYLSGLDDPGELLEIWSIFMSVTWSMDQVRVQKIYPVRTTYMTSQIVLSGQQNESSALPLAAFTVTKKGSGGGRRSVGSVHFSGFVPSVFAAGNIKADVLTWWTNQFGPLYTADQVTPFNIRYRPVLYNPGVQPNYQQIWAWQPQNTARTMHRRTVGIGE